MGSDRRQRKRELTYLALGSAALELTLERGVDSVTIEDIADRAGVSPRTFFNYFPSKEDAIVGISPDAVQAVVADLRDRPADEPPTVSLASILSTSADDADAAARRWARRAEVVRRHPALLAPLMASYAALENALTEVIAERLGLDPAVDPYPRRVVVAAVSMLRSTISWWQASGRPGTLPGALEDAFADLSRGFPAPARGRR